LIIHFVYHIYYMVFENKKHPNKKHADTSTILLIYQRKNFFIFFIFLYIVPQFMRVDKGLND
jgi:hypothetical protein